MKTVKSGYHAEAVKGVDLNYFANLWAEVKDTYLETRDLVVDIWFMVKQIYNLVLQIVELVTAIIPIFRSVAKRWIDVIRAHFDRE